jgi:hypothetical protein
MAYIYLLDIYKLIDRRIEDAKILLAEVSDDKVEKNFQEGRINALKDFKAYLTTNFNPKLPRRIRQSLKRK